jgi:hypothetical protein
MKGSLFDTLLESVDLDKHLLPYLDLSGWQQVDTDNRNWSVWQMAALDDEDPYELIFPQRAKTGERREYARKAIEFLSGLRDEREERTIQRVINYDRDVLFLRNTGSLRNSVH